ncbi:potassium channel family protein [Thermodesulfatator atlanticus]|uniref:potassium channel family protein n=1 Tax=Thermodesulfatator atlanticus TaxID=501497 RepID=UPI0003B7875C|nr:potassium channel family protein [Thermodesulfatator atlanticus]
MFFLFLKKIERILRKHDWLTLIVILLTLHCISAFLLLVFDYQTFAEDSLPKTLWKGTWWFFVTATTVGYGDVIPQSIPGQVIAIFDMIFGIGLMFTIIGAGTDKIIERRKKRLKGLQEIKHKDHIVILGGGAPKKLKTIIRELRKDFGEHAEIVVCSDKYKENPYPEEVDFVFGKIDQEETLKKANLKKAQKVIIYGINDEESILSTMAVDDFNKMAFITVYLRDRENIKHINRINKARQKLAEVSKKQYPKITTVTRIYDLMLARELSNPELSDVVFRLMRTGEGNTFYSIQAWPDMNVCIKVPEIRKLLRKTEAHALLLGIKRYETNEIIINPDENIFVCPKDQLFVIAKEKPSLDWSKILNENNI